MSKEKYFPPEYWKIEYHCPHCNVYSKQYWSHIMTDRAVYTWTFLKHNMLFSEEFWTDWFVSKCEHCKEIVFWFKWNIVYPKKIIVPLPNDDLEEEIKDIYMEAAKVFQDSVRASAALLRLALQNLCVQLWWKWKNINDDIKTLVSKWLPSQVQRSLDILRITWNNAVHPWEINIEENSKIVIKLFHLINFIAEKMITEPKEVDFLFEWLPDWAKEAIEKRDN
jgi:hypothetical protein